MDKKNFKPRDVLRQNLKALMATKDGPKTQGALFRKSGVAQSTIGRILSDSGEDSGIETVEKLAKAYGLQGWQLMVAGMDPTNPPVLQPQSKEEKAFYAKMRDLYDELRGGKPQSE